MSARVATPDRHKEAFALMWYGCECGHRERMWNSRDGVTAFAVACPSCGQATLRHVEWSSDRRVSDHVPHRGQRVWRDGTPEDAVAIVKKRIAIARGFGYEIGAVEAKKIVYEARRGGDEFRPGWPTLVVVVEKGTVP